MLNDTKLKQLKNTEFRGCLTQMKKILVLFVKHN